MHADTTICRARFLWPRERRAWRSARGPNVAGAISVQRCLHAIRARLVSVDEVVAVQDPSRPAGQADVVIAGGCEKGSDVPIRYSGRFGRLHGAAKAMKKGPRGHCHC